VVTWFNVPLIASEIGDRYYPGEKLMLFTAALYSAPGRRLTIERRAVSLARALAAGASLGMYRAPEARLVVHIRDPLAGDTFLALNGPFERANEWVSRAIKRVKALWQPVEVRNSNADDIRSS
jgi:hypothetical protein